MKKSKFLLAGLLVLPLLISCEQTTYTPKHSYPAVDPMNPDASVNPGGGGDDSSGGEEEMEENMTVNFYLDFSHSDEPLHSMRWYMLKPLGECPEKAKLDDSKAADPLYGKFLGYSEYPSSIDESHLWDFAKDYKQSNVLNLYGIWVSQ